jgi:hypothetical protein
MIKFYFFLIFGLQSDLAIAPKDGCHFFYMFLWMNATLATSKNSLKLLFLIKLNLFIKKKHCCPVPKN